MVCMAKRPAVLGVQDTSASSSRNNLMDLSAPFLPASLTDRVLLKKLGHERSPLAIKSLHFLASEPEAGLLHQVSRSDTLSTGSMRRFQAASM